MKHTSDNRIKHDLILLAVCLITALLLGLFLFVFMKKGTSVKIIVGDNEDDPGYDIYTYSLDDDGYVIISFDKNGDTSVDFKKDLPDTGKPEDIPDTSGFNVLRIKDHTADMICADCPDLICVHSKSISRVGESIICLPHRLTVSITGTGNGVDAYDNDTDAVTW